MSRRYKWSAAVQAARRVGGNATPQAWNTLPVAPLVSVRITSIPRLKSARSRVLWSVSSRVRIAQISLGLKGAF